MEWRKKLFNRSYVIEDESFDEPKFHAYIIDNRIYDPHSQLHQFKQSDISESEALKSLYEPFTFDHGFSFADPLIVKYKEHHVLIGQLKDNDAVSPAYFSIPRILEIKKGQLFQTPMIDLTSIQLPSERALGYATKKNVRLQPYDGSFFEMNVDILENEASEFYIEVRASKKESTLMKYNSRTQTFTLDITESQMKFTEHAAIKSVTLNEPLETLRIFVDNSSIEIFLNNGAAVLSARIFPSEHSTQIKTSTESGQVFLQFTKSNLK